MHGGKCDLGGGEGVGGGGERFLGAQVPHIYIMGGRCEYFSPFTGKKSGG